MNIKKRFSYTLSLYILEKIGELGLSFIDAFFPKKYPEALLWRKILGLDESYTFSRKNFSVILSRLKAQKLVERVGAKKTARWRLTKVGSKFLRSRVHFMIQQKPDGIKRLVIFDIPETERKKRLWIRTELISIGYEQLQKSVWMGDAPLPQDFIMALDVQKLIGKVHIFSLRDRGTLEK